MKEALNSVEKCSKTKDFHEIVAKLEIIKAECDKGIEMKVAAGKRIIFIHATNVTIT